MPSYRGKMQVKDLSAVKEYICSGRLKQGMPSYRGKMQVKDLSAVKTKQKKLSIKGSFKNNF
jgi:hypothetical protein